MNQNIVQTMLIATYNVYFDPHLFIERFKWIITQLLKECDVVCLQEIPASQVANCETVLNQQGFFFQHFTTCGDYGNLIASKIPWESYQYKNFSQSLMGRNFTHITLKDPKTNQNIHIINTHLESMFQFQSTRESQMKEIIGYCTEKGILDTTIVCGDFNMVYKKTYIDKFMTPQVDQVTWFGSRCGNSKRNCRFDRIYTGSKIIASNLRTVGNEKIPGLDCYASDHDGVLLEVRPSDNDGVLLEVHPSDNKDYDGVLLEVKPLVKIIIKKLT